MFKEGADRRRENLPTGDEVIVIILDEYSEPGFRDIVLVKRGGFANQPRYHRINAAYAAYIPLYYIYTTFSVRRP